MSDLPDLHRVFESPAFGASQKEKDATLTAELARLTNYHYERCPPYARIVDAAFAGRRDGTVEEIPYLPVTLFKLQDLLSVSREKVSTVLMSSGTSGQTPSRIFLDADTADSQARALASIFRELLGPKRLPMLIIDSKTLLRDPRSFSARGAGVLGMMRLGRDHVWALDDNLQPDGTAIRGFLDKHSGSPFVVFGFTWVVWKHFAPVLETAKYDLSSGVLVHSGGWKKLEAERVSQEAFRERLSAASGLRRVVNFYGLVEQVGSVFVEGEDGLLRAPRFADVIVRDPVTFAPLPDGSVGLLEVVSMIPRSYPGHALLTEDLGVVEARDRGSWGGKAFRVLGRLPRSELRGCSDVAAAVAG